jgi:hypothetical protein
MRCSHATFLGDGEAKAYPPPPLEVIANSLVESSRMVSSDGYL